MLLIFSRRHETKPETLDLNAIVADIRNLLSRGVGAHIELTVTLAPDLPPIKADRGQIEQALSLAATTHDLQLLLTDSVMPRMSGQTLAEHITETRPELPVVSVRLYLSPRAGKS